MQNDQQTSAENPDSSNKEHEQEHEQEKNSVVIVDDDEDLLNILTFSFEAENFQVYGFTKGKEAVKFLSDKDKIKTLSLIILDRMLPDMDGMEILEGMLKTNPNDVPVLFLSVLSSEKDVLAGLGHGAVDYVSKPFNLPILIQKALTLAKLKNK